jgi:hypothetical protein
MFLCSGSFVEKKSSCLCVKQILCFCSCDKEAYISFGGMQATDEHSARVRKMSEC